MRESFDEQLVRLGQDGAFRLNLEPLADIVRKAVPVVAVGKHLPDAVRKMRRHGHALPAVSDHLGRFARRVDDDVGVLELFDLKAKTGEEEAVAGRQDGGETLFDRSKLSAVAEPYGEQRLLDDDARIEP